MTPAEEEKIMMTNNIERYTVCNDIAYPIHEDPEGDYVLYEDHVAAIEPYQQRIAELESQLEAIGAGGVSSQRVTSQRRGEPYSPRKPTEEEWARLTENGRRAWSGPVRAPSKLSNAEIMSLAYDVGAMPEQMTDGSLLRFARALLARYGQPVAPEGWQLVPKVPTHEMIRVLWTTITDNHDTTDKGYKAMLASAPKFGEEND